MQSFLDQLAKQGYQSLRFTDDICPAIRIRYLGAQASALVKVDTSADDLIFLHGVAASEAADSTVGTAGVLDLTAAAYDNCGQVVDAINASANWQAVLVGALRADGTQTSTTTNFLEDDTGAQAKSDNGMVIYWDGSTFLSMSVGLRPEGIARNMSGFSNDLLKQNRVIRDWKVELAGSVSKNTFASGTSVLKIYEDQTLKMQWDGGATTAEQFKTLQEVLYSANGKPLILRLTGSGFCTGYLGTWFRMVQM